LKNQVEGMDVGYDWFLHRQATQPADESPRVPALSMYPSHPTTSKFNEEQGFCTSQKKPPWNFCFPFSFEFFSSGKWEAKQVSRAFAMCNKREVG